MDNTQNMGTSQTGTGLHNPQNMPGQTSGNLKDQARETASKAGQKASETADSLKQQARDAARSAKEKGREVAHEMRAESEAFAESRKHDLAHRITGCGDAVRRAANKLREENDPNIARYADMLAERFQRAGDYIDTRDFSAMYRDVENFARRRPELVFGGLFVAGLVLSRFLKASVADNNYAYNDDDEDYWAEDDEPMASAQYELGGSPSVPQRVEPVSNPSVGNMGAMDKPWGSGSPS